MAFATSATTSVMPLNSSTQKSQMIESYDSILSCPLVYFDFKLPALLVTKPINIESPAWLIVMFKVLVSCE